MTPIVELRNLSIDFETDAGTVTAVHDVSLGVEEGEVLAIVGESGSGKTVTAKAILRMLAENATVRGEIILDGQDMIGMRHRELRLARGRDVAMVFQEPSTALNPVFTIGWQIAEGIRAHERVGTKEVRRRAVALLSMVGIPEPEARVDYYPHQLSGGQKQRAVIAMALALDAKVIVADEPTTALDVTVQAEILDLLRRVRDEFGRSVILITHNMGVVADLADRVAVMQYGRVVEIGEAQELFSAPSHRYTADLLGSVPKLPEASVEDDATAQTGATARASMVVEAQPTTPVVRATRLGVAFPGAWRKPPFQAVRSVTFDLQPGEVLGLVGESGSGKTTIGRAIAGLVRPSGGSLQVLGAEMTRSVEREFRPIRPRIGFVFQDPATSFNPKLSVELAIAEPILVHGASASMAQARARVEELLDQVHLPREFAGRYPHELSGGQRQRASLARALALGPELLIADEPTSALDVSVQARVLDVFVELQERLGFATLFISHDLAVVGMLADRIAVLSKGDLVELGPSHQILTDPQHPYTQQLLSSAPVPDPEAQARRRQRWRELSPTE